MGLNAVRKSKLIDRKPPSFVPSKDRDLKARLKAVQDWIAVALPQGASLTDELTAERREEAKGE